MKITIMLKIVGILYRHGLRDLLIRYISDPNNDWDDKLTKALDEFFCYTEKVKNDSPGD